MHTTERLEQAIVEARRRGFEVRLEPLGDAAGGLCEYGDRKWIFVNLTATVGEQLEQILAALRTAKWRTPASRAA